MKPMSAFRLTALTCVWFALFSLIPALRVWSLAPVLVLGAILVASFAAVQLKHPLARLGVALLPLLTLLYAWQNGLMMTLVCAAPIVVIAIALATDHATIEYWRVKREFIALSVVCAILLLVSLNPVLFSAQCAVFVAAFFVFGFLALRAGRVGSYESAAWQTGNTGIFLATLAAVAGGGTLLMFGFDALVKWLKQFISDDKLIVTGTSNAQLVEESFYYQATLEPMSSPGAYVATEMTEDHPFVHVETQQFDIWWMVVGILLVLAIAALVVLLLARKKDKKAPAETLELKQEDVGHGARANRLRRRNRGKQTNNDKVREIYRNYLKHLRTEGVQFQRSATTSDVSERAATLAEDDTMLRTLYRKARYDNDQVTDEEVQLAQKCFEQLIAAKGTEQAEEPEAKAQK